MILEILNILWYKKHYLIISKKNKIMIFNNYNYIKNNVHNVKIIIYKHQIAIKVNVNKFFIQNIEKK